MDRDFYKQYPEMQEAEAQELLPLAQNGDEEAREKIICGYLRFVNYLNTRWGNTEDGFQQGIFGLIRAIEKYDINKKVKFSTYASYWIEHHIRRWEDYERYNTNISLIRNKKKVDKAREENLELTDEELRKKLRMQKEVFEAAKRLSFKNISLQFQSGNDGRFEEIIGTTTDIEKAELKLLNEYLYKLVDKVCSKAEKQVINTMFFEQRTEKEARKKLGKTVQSFNFLKNKALKKLRKAVMDEDIYNRGGETGNIE